MMNCVKWNTMLPIISRRPISAFSQNARRLFSEKKVETTQTPSDSAVYEKPRYATRSSYETTIKSSRISREADADTGVKPTSTQRWFLIITGLFRNRQEIPQYIPNQTMNRMHDRMRIVYIIGATSIFFAIFYIAESRTSKKIERDRAAGKVVTKMA